MNCPSTAGQHWGMSGIVTAIDRELVGVRYMAGKMLRKWYAHCALVAVLDTNACYYPCSAGAHGV